MSQSCSLDLTSSACATKPPCKMDLSDNTSGTPSTPIPSPTPVRRKRLIPADFYLSDEEVLIQLQKKLKDFRTQSARYKQELRNRSSHSLHYRCYSDRLRYLRNAIASLKHDIRIYQIRVYGYVTPTSSRSGRTVIPIARYQDEEFFSGSNNRHTKGRRVDVGKSIDC